MSDFAKAIADELPRLSEERSASFRAAQSYQTQTSFAVANKKDREKVLSRSSKLN